MATVSESCRRYLGDLDAYCAPAPVETVASVLGELALRYHEKQLSTEQLKVLFRGYRNDLADIPEALWPLMGERYRNKPGKSFFPQTWELRECVARELDAIQQDKTAAEALQEWASA